MNDHPNGTTALILAALAHGPCSTDALMSAAGVSRRLVSNKINRLKAQNRVRSYGKRGFQQPQLFRLVIR